MKRTFCFLLVFVLFFALPICAHADEENKPRLSEASDEEIQNFLSEYGIELPSIESNYAYWRDFILMVITKVEQDPDYVFAINYTGSLAFANAIKAAVNDYYGHGSICGVAAADYYTLVNSEQYTNWNIDHAYYNGYAFAIDQWCMIDPGDIRNNPMSSFNIDYVADLVVGDLESLNYPCIQKLTYLPSTRPAEAKVFCLRTGPYGYHVMKLSGGSWYHKPGQTLPLRWKYTSASAVIWTDERIIYDAENEVYVHIKPSMQYNSTIYYFVYKQDHSCTTSYGGEDYHSGNQHYYKVLNTCVHCGDTYYTWDVLDCNGPPCLDYSPYAHDDFELVEE